MLAPMQLTSLLVPGMQKQKWGLIVNIGSVAGGERLAVLKQRPEGHSLTCQDCLFRNLSPAVCNSLGLLNLQKIEGSSVPACSGANGRHPSIRHQQARPQRLEHLMLCGTYLLPASAVLLPFNPCLLGFELHRQCLCHIPWFINVAAGREVISACPLITECCLQALRNDNIKVVLINPAAVRTGGCLLSSASVMLDMCTSSSPAPHCVQT